jgi:hypothetical protein
MRQIGLEPKAIPVDGRFRPGPQASGLGLDPFILLHGFPCPEIEGAWRKFLRRVKCPSHYDAPEYFKEPFFADKKPFAVLALDGSDIIGVLTGIHERTATTCGLPNRPQINIAEGADLSVVARNLSQGLLAEANSSELVSFFSWDRFGAFGQYGFRCCQFDGDVKLDLSLGPVVLFRQFHENRRRNIRAAIRAGVEVIKASSPLDIESYYQVYCEWRRTPRKQIEGAQISFELFDQAFRLSGNRCAFLAKYSGKVIAGVTLRMFPGGLLEFAAGSAIEAYVHLKPNDLLHWRAIEWACKDGFCHYSLGAAHPFLRRFGGIVAPIYRHRIDRTLLRRWDIQEAVVNRAHSFVRRLPPSIRKGVGHFWRSTRRRPHANEN